MKVPKLLQYEEHQHINTVQIYSHPEYSIQAMYIVNYDASTDVPINFFATLINLESLQIRGPVVFYKIKNEKFVDLDPDELLNLHINFYFVNGCKYSKGNFEIITTNNYIPEIENMFSSYKKKIIDTWVILSESEETLNKIDEHGSRITDDDTVIWFRIKENFGDIAGVVSSIEHNKAGDYRGSFMELNESYIKKIFY